MTTEYRRMAQLRGTEAQWTANNVVLLAGEIALQTGPGLGEARAKVGDGVTAFGTLPWVFEVDQTARAGVAALDGSVTSLDSRVTSLEDQAAAGGSIAELQAQVAQNTTDIAARQMLLPVGASAGDVLHWDGTAYAATALSPAPVLGTILYWNPALGTYVGTAAGAVGQAMILKPGGIPGWGNPSSITVTVSNTVIPLAGEATVEDAFNAAAPTVAPDEVATVTWEGKTYHYIGAPGVAIVGAVAGDFVFMGIEDAPLDGSRYARKDGLWDALPPLFGEVINATLTFTGGLSIEDAFNTAAPTISDNSVTTIIWNGTKTYHYVGLPGVGITTAVAADFTQLGDLDLSGVTDAPADGKTYGRKDNAWIQLTAAYDLYFDFGSGVIAANAERALVLAKAITIPADLVGSQASLTTGDSSAPVFTLYEGATARATLTLTPTGGTWAAVVGATPIPIAAGVLVRLVAPATVAAAFTGLRASVPATRT